MSEAKSKYQWGNLIAGRMIQPKLEKGSDVEHLAELDEKRWLAISMPVKGVRCDTRMLELMDKDHDGRIRTDEVVGAVEFLKSKKFNFDTLFKPCGAEEEKQLADILAKQADLAKVEPSEADRKAMADWEQAGKAKEILVVGEGTPAAEATLAAVESVIETYFTPPEDMPLVTDKPDLKLPLNDHLNPKYLEEILAFSEKCVTPLLGKKEELSRLDWKKVRAAFAPYRAWVAKKPVLSAIAKDALDDEERVIRYRMHLLEFLQNYVNMERLYDPETPGIFQTGKLRIDAREMTLCFHVDDEAAHSALAEKSNCCVIYVKLTRPSENATRNICAVVTAGTLSGLYIGRNGVFYDRDGKNWEAVVSKVVESQISLSEAFWSPWRKLGDALSGMVKKFIGDRQANVQTSLEAGKLPPIPKKEIVSAGGGGGAAMASSVAAIGIGVGMVGAALASFVAAIKGMSPLQLLLALVAVIAIVSLPSMLLSWFKLRKRDLGAILNASGWAINRPMYFSQKLAASFTNCPERPKHFKWWIVALIVLSGALAGGLYWCEKNHYIDKLIEKCKQCEATAAEPAPTEAAPAEPAPEAAPAQ